MDEQIKAEYTRWCALADKSLQSELAAMDEKQIMDAFFRDLEFGTGGLRGELGAGTNRMNRHTVARASQGLANFILRHFPEDARRVAVSYDSRILSDDFALTAAEVFSANGITVFLYDRLMPTPCLSFAVRALSCAAGVMVTASHNPAQYNGYKVYGPDGCQITTEAAAQILTEIKAVDVFSGVTSVPFGTAMADGRIQYIPERVLDDYIAAVKAQSLLGGEALDKSAAIVYTPLNGTGREPVLRVLRECGFTNVTVVKEQEQPDGHFPTCPYPNPEIPEAMALGIQYARRRQAELVLATDPDCDRVGVAVRAGEDYILLSGNEMGFLLLDYICTRREALGTMPDNPVIIKTIVTSELGTAIAARHGVRTIDVLTGFKFIGEQINLLEQAGKADSFILGFEESYGYLSGSYVRDKDAVNAVLLICEMFSWHRSHSTTLPERLKALYAQVGYCRSTLHTYAFPGAEGFANMQAIMAHFRDGLTELGGKRIEKTLDYADGLDGLPKSNVLKFILGDGSSVVIRPSGTEPKLKAYLSIFGAGPEETERTEAEITTAIHGMMSI